MIGGLLPATGSKYHALSWNSYMGTESPIWNAATLRGAKRETYDF
jgi:hypothetical protein